MYRLIRTDTDPPEVAGNFTNRVEAVNTRNFMVRYIKDSTWEIQPVRCDRCNQPNGVHVHGCPATE